MPRQTPSVKPKSSALITTRITTTPQATRRKPCGLCRFLRGSNEKNYFAAPVRRDPPRPLAESFRNVELNYLCHNHLSNPLNPNACAAKVPRIPCVNRKGEETD